MSCESSLSSKESCESSLSSKEFSESSLLSQKPSLIMVSTKESYNRIKNQDIKKQVLRFIEKQTDFYEKSQLTVEHFIDNQLVFAINSNPKKRSEIVIIAFFSKYHPVYGFYVLLHAKINTEIKDYKDVIGILCKPSTRIHPSLSFDYCYYQNAQSREFFRYILPFYSYNEEFEGSLKLHGITDYMHFNIYVDNFYSRYYSYVNLLIGVKYIESGIEKTSIFLNEGFYPYGSIIYILKRIELTSNGSIPNIFTDCLKCLNSCFSKHHHNTLNYQHVKDE